MPTRIPYFTAPRARRDLVLCDALSDSPEEQRRISTGRRIHRRWRLFLDTGGNGDALCRAAHHLLNHRDHTDQLGHNFCCLPTATRCKKTHAVRVTTSFSAVPACWEWKLEAYIPQPTNARVFLHEGNIAPGETPEELWIVMRTADYDETDRTTDPPRAYSSVSRNGGRTWSVAKPEPDLHNAKSKAFFGRSSTGTHIYVYSDGPPQREKAPGFPNGGRTSLRYKTKNPGDTWSEEKTFYHAGIKNSYPTLIEIAPGDFRCVWDGGTPDTPRTHIHFGKLRISP